MYKLILLFTALASLSSSVVAQNPTPSDSTGAGNQTSVPISYAPAQTRVVILPIPNVSGEKWQELKQRQSDFGFKYMHDQLAKRGFVIVPDDDVTHALSDLHIDLMDEEQYRRETLYNIGKKLNATLVMFVVITDTNQKTTEHFLSETHEGHTKIKGWLVDAGQQQPIVSAKAMDGTSGGGAFGGLDKGSERQVIATANAIRDLFADFWKSYKEVKVDKHN